MTRPPEMGLVIMMLLGISGCAGAPQRFSWSSPPPTSEDRTDSPATARYSWWHRAGSQRVDAADPRQDLAQSSPGRSQPNETKGRVDMWPERRSDGLARFFPSLNRRRNAAETSRSVASERSDHTPNTARSDELHASRPVTRFRDVTPEPDEGRDTTAVGISGFAAANTPSSNEGEVLRASLPPRERSASTFTQEIAQPQSPVFQTNSDESKGSSLVPTSQPAPAPVLFAMNASGEPENLLPQSLMRDQEGPSDSPVALAPIQEEAPSSKRSSDTNQAQKPSSASAPAQKPSSKSTTPPPPRRKPATPAPSSSAPSAEPKKSTAATKPAAGEMKLQSPDLEPAPAIQPPSSAREAKPEAPKGVSSTPSPPPVPSAAPEPAVPSAPAPAAASSPPAAAALPSAATASPPAASGSAPAGYTLSPAAQPGPAETLSWPSLDGRLKSLPSAQLPPPLFPSSYGWSAPTVSQVLPSPQTAFVACATKTKKCGWTSGKCKLFCMRKLRCLTQFIHEHCPFKKKAAKTCCRNCPCCGPMYIGAMPSAQWIQGSPLFGAASIPVNPSPATPQASRSAAPVGQEAEDASPASLSPLDSSAGTKPGDVSQGGEDLKPIAPEGLDKTP